MSQQPNEIDWSIFETAEDAPSVEDDYFTEQAEFCLASGVSWPDYDNMTRAQVNKWIEVLNKRNSK